MNNLLKSIGTILKIILAIPCVLLLVYLIERGLGFYPGGHFPTVAKIAAEQSNVEICHKIIRAPWLTVMGPSIAERQISCIHDYAALTKDPSACELLMPSSYGLSCVGGATSANRICNFYDGDTNVYWREENGKSGKASFSACQSDDSSASDLRNQCCLMIRVAFIKTENACSSLAKTQSLYDECQNNLAWKNRDPDACASIHDMNLRIACEVRTKALKANPSICEGCRAPVENLSELQ